MKVCTKCGVSKNESEFYDNESITECKECFKKRQLAYYERTKHLRREEAQVGRLLRNDYPELFEKFLSEIE